MPVETTAPAADEQQMHAQPPVEELLYSGLRFEGAPKAERIAAGEPFALDPERPLAEYEGFNVLAEVDAGDTVNNPFLVLDLRKSPQQTVDGGLYRNPGFAGGDLYNTDFLLVSKDFGGQDPGTGFKGIRAGQTFTVGASHLRDRFAYTHLPQGGPVVSPDHFRVGMDANGQVVIEDLHSHWGTFVRQGAPKEVDEANIDTVPRDKLRGTLMPTADHEPTESRDQAWSKMIAEKGTPDLTEPDANKWWKPPEPVSAPQSAPAPQPQEQWWQEAEVQEAQLDPQEAEVAEEVGEVATEESVVLPDAAQDIVIAEQQPVAEPAAEAAPDDQVDTPATEAAEAQEQPKVPELSEVFASPDAFERALNDGEVSPDFRRELRSVYQAWQELRLAGVTGEVWDELIAPRLAQVSEVTPQMIQLAQRGEHEITQMADGLQQLATAVQEHDQEKVLNVVNHFQFGTLREGLKDTLKQLDQSDLISGTSRHLMIDTWDSDERIQRVHKGINYGFDAALAEQMIDDLREKAMAGASLAQMRDELREQQKQGPHLNWQRKRNDIEMITQFGHMTDADIAKEAAQLDQVLDDVFDAMRNHRQNPADISYAAARANNLQEPIQTILRMSRLVDMATQEARKQ